MASVDYYQGDPSNFGNYQYITLEDIVNNYIMSGQDDDYSSNIPRYKVLYQARRAFREMYFDVTREIKAIELELSPTLQVVLPPDFVSFVRVSWVGEDGKIHPMSQDTTMNIAKEYLQDQNYELLFDENGCVLEGDGNHQADNLETIGDSGKSYNDCYRSYGIGHFNPNKNHANQFPNGKFKVDKSSGVIRFGSEVSGSLIVLEYISDGLWTGCEGLPEHSLRIHKFCESAVLNYIYWQIISRRRNVPEYEKRRAEKGWWNMRRIAKRRMNALNYNELLQVFKGSNRWIKGV